MIVILVLLLGRSASYSDALTLYALDAMATPMPSRPSARTTAMVKGLGIPWADLSMHALRAKRAQRDNDVARPANQGSHQKSLLQNSGLV